VGLVVGLAVVKAGAVALLNATNNSRKTDINPKTRDSSILWMI